jgi:AraC-like DNA-binding protein
MTRCLITPLAAGDQVFGIRFHPAMSHGLLGAPVASLTDVVADLDALWGKNGRMLAQRLGESTSFHERAALIETVLQPAETLTPVQRAAICIVRAGGCVSPDDLASRAGLSARQFRRLCVDQAGIGVKTLCRIVRFRRAAIEIANPRRSWADFALDHGYYDQAHFINEFKEFSGLTPSAYVCSFSPPNPPDAAKS